MKILVFGDVHGNLIALEKMYKSFQNKVDLFICHGDVVNYGPWSNECVLFLRDKNCICLKGNHEKAYLKGEYLGKNKMVQDFFERTFANFEYNSILKTYKDSYQIEGYFIAHTIYDKYYYPDSDLSDLNLQQDTIIGHSHYPFIRKTNSGKYLINTGSVGQNRKDLSIINFALLDTQNNTREIKKLSYDPMPLITEMKIRNYPKSGINYYISKLKK